MCPQIKSGTSRWWLVPKTAGGAGRPRVVASELREGAHDHGDRDARTVRQRAWTRVRRGVYRRVLETGNGGMETVQKMGRQTGETQ